ncbi:hypothetical protein GW758_00530 [Candidatus Falkowbacteria bacterium]|nr:hypothetical protein [Candidatus Falkowbacteria bacterium]
MFNDLTGNQDASSQVDDIFAETDKTPTNGNNIETRQVGLSSFSDTAPAQEVATSSMPDVDAEKTGSAKFLKIAIFSVVGAILILGGYLVYTNFLKVEESDPFSQNEVLVGDNTENEVEVVDNTQANNQNNNSEDFVVPIVDQDGGLDENEVVIEEETEVVINPAIVDSDGDGLSDYDEVNIHGTNPNLIDTDFDGLSDYEEVMTHKTDPLKADTDDDGLSDYEEVKVYGSDPLKADTDDDGYSDGEEVKAGYNPLGDGRLPGF